MTAPVNNAKTEFREYEILLFNSTICSFCSYLSHTYAHISKLCVKYNKFNVNCTS